MTEKTLQNPLLTKKWIRALIGLTLLVGLCGLLLFYGIIRFNYPSLKAYPIRGIDISHHQGVINWQKLQNENIDFVFIKATEGGDFVDPTFYANWDSSLANGYVTGAYHFYRLCKTGKEQAANVIATVPRLKGCFAPAIDLEFGGNCSHGKSEKQIISEIQDFMNAIEKHYDQRPVIYATAEFYDTYLRNQFTDYPIWIRNIYRKPNLPDKRDWTFWQFANRAHLKGIDSYVDLNVMNGSQEDFMNLTIAN